MLPGLTPFAPFEVAPEAPDFPLAPPFAPVPAAPPFPPVLVLPPVVPPVAGVDPLRAAAPGPAPPVQQPVPNANPAPNVNPNVNPNANPQAGAAEQQESQAQLAFATTSQTGENESLAMSGLFVGTAGLLLCGATAAVAVRRRAQLATG